MTLPLPVALVAMPDATSGSRFGLRATVRRIMLDLIGGAAPSKRGIFARRLDRQSTRNMLSVVLGEDFPATKHAVAIDRIEFAKSRPPPRFVRGDQCRARTSEEVEHDAAAARNIFHRIGDHCDRLDRWMQSKLVESACFEGVDASIFPNVGAIAPMLAELETVDVRGVAVLESKDELVP